MVAVATAGTVVSRLSVTMSEVKAATVVPSVAMVVPVAVELREAVMAEPEATALNKAAVEVTGVWALPTEVGEATVVRVRARPVSVAAVVTGPMETTVDAAAEVVLVKSKEAMVAAVVTEWARLPLVEVAEEATVTARAETAAMEETASR